MFKAVNDVHPREKNGWTPLTVTLLSHCTLSIRLSYTNARVVEVPHFACDIKDDPSPYGECLLETSSVVQPAATSGRLS